MDAELVAESLVNERTVDIVTTGRRSGQPRTTEIWTTVLDGTIYICGTPGASQASVEHQPRDWLANLLAEPALTLRLKQSIAADLPARAVVVADPDERTRVMTAPQCSYYRANSSSFEHLVAAAPMVRVELIDAAADVGDTIRARSLSTTLDAR